MSWSVGIGPISLGGGSDGGNSGRRFAYRQAQNAIQWRVADARAAGIHPLAALGIPLSSGPMASGGGSGSPDFQASFDLKNMMQMFSKEGRAARKRQEEADKYNLEWLRLRNMGLKKQIERGKQEAVDEFGLIGGQSDEPSTSPASTNINRDGAYSMPGRTPGEVGKPGVEMIPQQFGVNTILPKEGRYVRKKIYPSQSVQENTSEGWHETEYFIKNVVKRLKFGLKSGLPGKWGRDVRDDVREYRKLAGHTRNGYHWEYDITWDEFVEVPNKEGFKLFFNHPRNYPYWE